MDDDKAKAFLESIGAMAEMCALMYTTLVHNHVPKTSATQITCQFLAESINLMNND